MAYQLNIEIDQEEDGRWIAEIADLPGVMAYGESKGQAVCAVEALALRVLADRIEEQRTAHETMTLSFACA
ncbi:MAG: type II toxin-antitoxin system HicB family antitoxin [Acidobacteriota bacterium]|nr:type II toxin-antitoxin system HicB family antitoxin [Acidobacteriota bacterium]